MPAGRILDRVGELVHEPGLITPLLAGYRICRAQSHKEPTVSGAASRLDTAPREFAAQANRMSPAGIPMFYGAQDPETADFGDHRSHL
ncbi:RES family NAD+ phosphorylase [Streptomyces halobius]|uniref:RES family NAD+ phosphorylase n=1 Tax=Streptomyces halobius TaxID=2879846 RepID=A0ABY4MHQ7_9ACTN|nr:RES family NAD+ phosphorylase [Streptomyces halobius]